jgi:hypothetical protein
VLGPLPPLYRLIVTVCALSACLGLGAWMSMVLTSPLLAGAAVSVGGALGVLALVVLLREPPQPHRRAVRIDR